MHNGLPSRDHRSAGIKKPGSHGHRGRLCVTFPSGNSEHEWGAETISTHYLYRYTDIAVIKRQ